jgi:Protein of unknown function (DUF4232)
MQNILIRTGVIGAALISVVGVTSFALASTSAPARSAALTAAASVPKCTAATLAVWVAADEAAYGVTDYYPLEFTNTGGRTCALYGYPGVSGLNASGKQVGSPAQWVKFAVPRTVTLAPGATAHAQLAYRVQLIGSERQYMTPVTELRVYLPGQKAAAHAFFSVEGITIDRPYLEIGPVELGF